MISGSGLISVLVTLVVVGLVCYLLWWLIGYIGLPEPFNKVARVIVACIAVVFLINLILGLGGHPLVSWNGH
jgi:hypothetical protein